MKRRLLLLLAAYVVAGIVGTALYGLTFATRKECIDQVLQRPLQSAILVLVWPVILTGALQSPGGPGEWRVLLPGYLIPAVMCYLLLARLFPRPFRQGFCSACGYDLRATPEAGGPLLTRCPECGRVPPEAHAAAKKN